MNKDTIQLNEMLAVLNPFRIKGDDGIYTRFGDYGKCYYFVIMFVYKNFKSGYVDLVLLVQTLTQMPIKDAERFVKKMNLPFCVGDYYFIHWLNPDGDPFQKAETLLRGLHLLTHTLFSPDYFRWAWDEFEKQKCFEN